MTRFILAFAFVLGAAACDSCGSCGKKGDAVDAGPKKAMGDPHAPPAPPPPGSDADTKLKSALALASAIDGQLATFAHGEKAAQPNSLGQPRKAECWYVDDPKQRRPKKLILKDLDAAGSVQSETDYYYDDKQMVAYVKASDGHFVFGEMEGLALWLDPEQRIKRGIKPMDALNRANQLKKDMTAALISFAIR